MLPTTHRHRHFEIDSHGPTGAVEEGRPNEGRRGPGGARLRPDRERVIQVISLTRESSYCHCEYMTAMKGDRLQLRVDPEAKRRIERAAEAAHQSVSAFMLQSAESRAEEILADRLVITLSPDAAQRFAAALNKPAAVNDRLARALQRPSKFSWLD